MCFGYTLNIFFEIYKTSKFFVLERRKMSLNNRNRLAFIYRQPVQTYTSGFSMLCMVSVWGSGYLANGVLKIYCPDPLDTFRKW